MTKTGNGLKPKPLIFLVFANDRAKYLRNLRIERRGIQKVMDKAIREGLCKVEVRTDAAIEDILDVFQDREFRDRIAIFHYSGHAEDYALIVDTFEGKCSPAYKEGLVSFLAGQNGLKLVFLNGCSTKQIALDLGEAGIPAVIGTSQAIEDEVAMKLAIRFYHGIANGSALERAWQEAEKGIKIQKGTSCFKAYYSVHKTGHEDRFPWDIFFQEDVEKIKEWKLPDAVDDPLFGLPAIPNTYGLPESPFLFLNRYERKHARIFFGRSHDIRELYNRVTDKKSPLIILLYGQSGVGKSSLLEAGFLPRVEESHTVLYTRRNPEKGLIGTLEEALENHLLKLGEADQVKNASIQEKWKRIESETNNPLVIILDQAEEIFTRSNGELPNEFNDFLEALLLIFAEPLYWPKGKLILGYRKEYHPEIEKGFIDLEISRSELFLEPLSRQGIIEVVSGIKQKPGLKQRYRNLDVEEGLPDIIADDLSKDKKSSIAPVLQIILTKMWEKTKSEHPHPNFTVEKYQEIKKQGIAMEDFLRQQMGKLKNWKEEVVNSGLALDVLKYHTTEFGTACSRKIKDVRQTYRHRNDIIDNLVKQLKHLYLLTDTNHSKNETSLAHDTLAPIVIKEYNESDKPGQRAATILVAKRKNFKSDLKVRLYDSDLVIVQEGRRGMKALEDEEERLFEDSLKDREEREKNKKRIKRTVEVLIAIIILFAMFAGFQWRSALHEARKNKSKYYTIVAQSRIKDDPTFAIRCAERAYYLNKSETVMQVLSAAAATTWDRPFYSVIMPHDFHVKHAVFSPSGDRILTVSPDKTLKLWDLQGNCLTGFPHRGVVYSAEFSPDGGKILTASRDNAAKLWDLKGNLLKNFKHKKVVTCAGFSPVGRRILTASYDNTAKLWDLQGNLLADLTGHSDYVKMAVFSPDGTRILTVCEDKTARLWDSSGSFIKNFNGVISAKFSPKDKQILTVFSDNPVKSTVKLWDWDGSVLKTFNTGASIVTSAAFSPDGTKILTAYLDGTLKLWDLNGCPTASFDKHKDRITFTEFSPDGTKILTASVDHTASLWDLQGKLIANFDKHKDRVTSAVFSPDGGKILTASRDGTAVLWDLKNQPTTNFYGHGDAVTIAVFSPDGAKILTVSRDNFVQLWDLQGNQAANFNGHTKIVNSAAFSPDGTKILTASADHTARLWDIDGNPLKEFNHKANVNSAVFSPDGKKILTASFDKTVKLWNLKGKMILNLDKHPSTVNWAVFSPDGGKILGLCCDNTVKLWDLQGNPLTGLEKDIDWVDMAIFSPDGTKVLTACDGRIHHIARLWDLNGRPLAIMKNPIKPRDNIQLSHNTVTAAAFSPDGSRVLTAIANGTVKLWDLQGNILLDFNRHKGIVNSAVFSPDGGRVLTASADGTVKLWDLQGNILSDFDEHKGIVYSAVFSPDGERVLTASADGTAKLWHTPEAIVQWLKTAKIPPLPRGKSALKNKKQK